MHILVTNDDGPPSLQSSPYILPFVRALEQAGHVVSVIIPDTQRSWIGKAHMVGQSIRASAYWPPSQIPDTHEAAAAGSTQDRNDGTHPWVLIDSTPASCAQLGLSRHFFNERGDIDLVISGPNFGRNTTAVFALSSGTLGAALEAAGCGHRAVALSFAFFDRNHDAEVIGETCAHAVKVCSFLAAEEKLWLDQARLYSVNVPVQRGVGGKAVRWTRCLQNRWMRGACFQEIESGGGAAMGLGPAAAEKEKEEGRLRMQEGEGGSGGGREVGGRSEEVVDGDGGKEGKVWNDRHFKWAPRFTDVYESVEKAGPGSDGWTVKAGETSITALKANFMHVEGMEGEVKL